MFARIEATETIPAMIVFYYLDEAIFDNVSLRSQYRAKNIKSEKGESLVDDFAITQDERDAFDLFLEQSIYDAFNIVMKMTTGVPNAVILRTSVADILEDPEESEELASGFKVKDFAAYNENNLSLVDDGVKNLILAFIMKEWYKMNGLDTELAKWLNEYNEVRRDLVNKRLFQLRKHLIQ